MACRASFNDSFATLVRPTEHQTSAMVLLPFERMKKAGAVEVMGSKMHHLVIGFMYFYSQYDGKHYYYVRSTCCVRSADDSFTTRPQYICID